MRLVGYLKRKMDKRNLAVKMPRGRNWIIKPISLVCVFSCNTRMPVYALIVGA